jgi:hypothetical protein
VARDNFVVPVGQDRRIEAERLDAFRDCAYLRAAMLAWIVWIRNEIPDRDKQDLPARGYIACGGN